jgi:hypothetical protein
MMKKVIFATILAAVSIPAIAQADTTTFKCKSVSCALTCNVNGQVVNEFSFSDSVKVTRQHNGTNSYFMFGASLKDIQYDATPPQSCLLSGDLVQQQ